MHEIVVICFGVSIKNLFSSQNNLIPHTSAISGHYRMLKQHNSHIKCYKTNFQRGYGLQTTLMHQYRSVVVCLRQKKTTGARSGYGTSKSLCESPSFASGASGAKCECWSVTPCLPVSIGCILELGDCAVDCQAIEGEGELETDTSMVWEKTFNKKKKKQYSLIGKITSIIFKTFK